MSLRLKPGVVVTPSSLPSDLFDQWRIGLALGTAHYEAMGNMDTSSPLRRYTAEGDAITIGLRLLAALEAKGFGVVSTSPSTEATCDRCYKSIFPEN